MKNNAKDNEFLLEEQAEMYEHYHFIVSSGQSPIRIDRYLTARIEGISRNKVQCAAEAGCILANNKPVKSSYLVKGNDEISVLLPYPVREIEILPEDIPVEIIYEDNDVAIINKCAGMVVHPGYGNYTGTMLNALLFHFQKNDDTRSFPYLVHRIDKDTTGLIVIAKNEKAQTYLGKQFYEHKVLRKYYALAWGNFSEDTGTINGHLARDPSNRKVMKVFKDAEKGKHAITHYKVIERYRFVTLVECSLETGRTHQIRAHFKYIGHPLFADELYGGNKIHKGDIFSKYKQFIENCFQIINRQALHAYILGFKHPCTEKLLHFEIPLPQDMELVIQKWKKYSEQK